MTKIQRRVSRVKAKPRDKQSSAPAGVKIRWSYKPVKLPYRPTPHVEKKIEEAIDQLPI